MGNVLKWGGIGCGGLVVVIVLIAIGAAIGGGGGGQAGSGGGDGGGGNTSQSDSGGGSGGGQPEQQQAPADSGGGSTVVVRVTGDQGVAFSGSYGTLDRTESVDGVTPAEYEIEGLDTGALSLDSVNANAQKQAAGSQTLTVEIVVDGEVVKEASTSAEYGVAQVNWSPSEQ